MTTLDIAPRQDGESDADYWRRYNREKQRIYRARKPKPETPRRRGRGKATLKNSKLTPEQWAALQPRDGEDPAEWRRRYNRERQAIMRARDGVREKELERRRAAYALDIEAARSQARAKHAANPERQRAADRRQREKYPDKAARRLARLEQWGKDNADRLKSAKEVWNETNRALLAHYSAKWRRCCRIATPPWADFEKIKAFYEEARRLTDETGVPHEVDHIVPVQGRGVCGLHVHTNLRVITAKANCVKRNRLDQALVESLMWADYWAQADVL